MCRITLQHLEPISEQARPLMADFVAEVVGERRAVCRHRLLQGDRLLVTAAPVARDFMLNLIGYNLVRLPKLLAT